MILTTGLESWQLESLQQECVPSVESFLQDIEEQLERGEITLADAALMIQDFHQCK